MKELVRSAWQWLADTRLARRVVDSLFGGKARRRVVGLDHQSVARCQNRTLLGLVHKAHTTRFGRDHDFRRIRSAGDFRRLVPLRTAAQLWREYWQPAYPDLAGVTWPGPIPYLAVSSVQPNEPFPCTPLSPDLLAAQQTAALTALAFVLYARPRARLCSGRLCLLGGGKTLMPAAESLEALAVRLLPPSLRHYALAAVGPDGGASDLCGDRHLLELAERSALLPVTCLSGTADHLARFFAHAKRVTGRECIADIWPGLAAVLYARGVAGPDRQHLIREVGSEAVLCLEMYLHPEGAVALEDPRHGRLRLLPDHGIYFEFVPVEQVGKMEAARYSAAEVKVGAPYALALSSPAGVWACLVGSVVQFERLDPPLLRLVERGTLCEPPALLVPQPARLLTSAHPFLAQPPHPRTTSGARRPAGRPSRSSSWPL
jgi:hypothetical protein